jgi:hypothetical protein
VLFHQVISEFIEHFNAFALNHHLFSQRAVGDGIQPDGLLSGLGLDPTKLAIRRLADFRSAKGLIQY